MTLTDNFSPKLKYNQSNEMLSIIEVMKERAGKSKPKKKETEEERYIRMASLALLEAEMNRTAAFNYTQASLKSLEKLMKALSGLTLLEILSCLKGTWHILVKISIFSLSL